MLFQNLTGIETVHVPYKGSAPALADLVGGNIDLMFDNLATRPPAASHRPDRAILGVGTAARSPSLPDAPTIEQQGLAGYRSSTWFALVAPPRTERPIADRIAADVADILKLDDVRERLTSLGLEPIGNGRIRTGGNHRVGKQAVGSRRPAAKLPRE